MLDYHVILDLVPALADLYFTGRIDEAIKASGVQQAILLAVGLQRKDIDSVASELNLPSSQLLAMFMKIIRKFTTHFAGLVWGDRGANAQARFHRCQPRERYGDPRG